jgi:hypothetical protein
MTLHEGRLADTAVPNQDELRNEAFRHLEKDDQQELREKVRQRNRKIFG